MAAYGIDGDALLAATMAQAVGHKPLIGAPLFVPAGHGEQTALQVSARRAQSITVSAVS